MGRFLKVLKVAGDVAEIIVASSILLELLERYRSKRKSELFFLPSEKVSISLYLKK